LARNLPLRFWWKIGPGHLIDHLSREEPAIRPRRSGRGRPSPPASP
jgi:hypothetical protein